jgi:hypothetical protein
MIARVQAKEARAAKDDYACPINRQENKGEDGRPKNPKRRTPRDVSAWGSALYVDPARQERLPDGAEHPRKILGREKITVAKTLGCNLCDACLAVKSMLSGRAGIRDHKMGDSCPEVPSPIMIQYGLDLPPRQESSPIEVRPEDAPG